MKTRKPAVFVAIAGPGAIGGTLAASLRRAGEEIVLVTRDSAGAARIRRRGLSVTRPSGRAYRVRGWLDVSPRPKRRAGCKAVFLCVKSAGLEKSLKTIRAVTAPDTPVVSLLNGVTQMGPLLRAYGSTRAVFGICYFGAVRTGPTKVLHRGGKDVMLAETSKNKAACRAAQALLRRAGWRVRTTGSPERLLWTKAAYNAAINPLGALTKMPNDQLAKRPALRELMIRVLSEAAAIARGAGYPSLDAHPERLIVQGCLAAPGQINSMAQDIAAGRPTEADAILLPLLRAARRAGRTTRYIEPLYRMIRGLEAAAS